VKPFLVDTFFGGLRLVQRVTPFELLIRALPAQTKDSRAGVTEAWVVAHFIFSILVLTSLPRSAPRWLQGLACGYGAFRVFEVVLFQFFSQILGGYPTKEHPRLHYTVVSLRRSILLAGLLYLETLVWFSTFYQIGSGCFKTDLPLDNALVALYYSTVTITTLGYGDVSAIKPCGFSLVIVETLVGFFMTLLILARVVSYLPAPRSTDPNEQAPVPQSESSNDDDIA
jgi:hypothetical protein